MPRKETGTVVQQGNTLRETTLVSWHSMTLLFLPALDNQGHTLLQAQPRTTPRQPGFGIIIPLNYPNISFCFIGTKLYY